MRRPAVLLSLTLLASTPGLAQGRRAITQDDYDRWRTAQAPTLAPTGTWAAWTEVPQVGDGDLVIRETRGTREVRVPRGFLGRPIVNLTAGTDSPFVAPPPQFTADGSALVAIGYAPMAEFERARRARPRALAVPRSSLIIVPLTGSAALQPVIVPRVRSVRVPRDAGTVLAYLLEADTATARAAGDTIARRTADSTPPRPATRREYGTTLVIRTTVSGIEQRIADVNSYAIDPTGTYVAYTVVSRTPDRDGAAVRTVATGVEAWLLRGTGNYKAITFDREGRQVAFVSDKDEVTADKPRYAAYHALIGRNAAARRVVAGDAFAPRATLSDRQVGFSRDGSTLVLGAAPIPADSIPADSLTDRA